MLFPQGETSPKPHNDGSYLVFARKYRPQDFSTLIGQNHLIDILRNAFDAQRIAHAYILTGVRGVGKTTTARILAKGFNCTGMSDKIVTAPTISPCGLCHNCISITSGKNIDVFEMDAASRTGIDDIREIIDSLPYKPLTCRYKVFIIDEVHMLSKSAFNGLLKTLEEPPSHVKFIFATTEIHKIPATILSRCQRLDLKRVEIKTLIQHFETICTQENITYDISALAKIARVADGSVRDGLSLLDQAVASGNEAVTLEAVSQMLGTSQTGEILEILELCQLYDASAVLRKFYDLYVAGFDPILFIKELLRHIEWLIRFKHTPELAEDLSLPEDLRQKAKELAEKLTIPLLSRMWDIALKACNDIIKAPDPLAVCEVALIRMIYGLNVPDPLALLHHAPSSALEPQKKNLDPLKPVIAPANIKNLDILTFEDLLKLLSEKRALNLKKTLEMDYIISDYQGAEMTLCPVSQNSSSVLGLQAIAKELEYLTQKKWVLHLKQTQEGKTKRAEILEIKELQIKQAEQHPIVQAVYETFAGAKIIDIKEIKMDNSLVNPEHNHLEEE